MRFAAGQITGSASLCEYLQRRMDGAHRSYLSALRTLAQVRRLAVPALQINVARRQVNVAGGPAVAPAPDDGDAP